MNNTEYEINSKVAWFLDMLISFSIGCFVGVLSFYGYNKSNKPIENTTKIDSLINVNDSIKIKVEKLDSIKDAKIIEVSTLNNDSTLKLFYKLVSE